MFNKALWLFGYVGVVAMMIFVALVGTDFVKIKKAKAAAAAYPYQVGLKNVIMTPCTGVIVCPPVTLCQLKAPCPPSNPVFWDIKGIPAGGMGMNIVISDVQAKAIMLAPGDNIIAGGMGPTLFDFGVIANNKGVIGSTAFHLASLTDAAKEKMRDLLNRIYESA